MEKQSFLSAIEQICEEKGISKEKVLETIEVAIAAAYKKDFGHKGQNIRAKFDLETGAVRIFQVKLVVDESMIKTPEEIEAEKAAGIDEEKERTSLPSAGADSGLAAEEEKKVRFNPEKHIMVEEAQAIQEGIKTSEELWTELESKTDFGRIAAQTAKQVIIQRIREAERETVYEEFKTKEGEVVSGIVQRVERGMVFVDIGKAVGVIFPEEQIHGEHYRIGQRLRVLILQVAKDARGPGIILSRTHAKMLSKLFELEVPEIAAGSVEIKAIAREVGSRSKIAVASVEEGVDPIGSCVGQKGTRVQAVINELGGEKIDVIEWSENPAKFIGHALSPAKVLNVDINEAEKSARVDVPEDQLSLAIGKKGQNVRLAAKLTGWKIDVAGARETEKPEETEKIEEAGEAEAEVSAKEAQAEVPAQTENKTEEFAKVESAEKAEAETETKKEKPKEKKSKKAKKKEE